MERYDDIDAICDLCLESKLLTKDYWYPRALEYIREGGTGWFRYKQCTDKHKKKKSIKKDLTNKILLV